MKQIEIARKYLGQKENQGNTFDENSLLGKLLHEAGQKDGEAWCCYFAEGVFCEAFPAKNAELRKLFSASTIQTYQNFKESGLYTCGEHPAVGDLVIWQRFKDNKPTWQGHAGLVTKVNADGSFHTIEGNTNGVGSREGDSVQEKHRKRIRTTDGLNVLGFVTIK